VVVAIVGAVITLAFPLVVFQAYQTSVDYWIEGSDTLSKGIASVTIHCNNSGSADVEFNLVLKLANLTSTIYKDQTSLRDITAVQTVLVMDFRFTLHKGESTQKTAYFLYRRESKWIQTHSFIGKDKLLGHGKRQWIVPNEPRVPME
jgi:hypothetical protein